MYFNYIIKNIKKINFFVFLFIIFYLINVTCKANIIYKKNNLYITEYEVEEYFKFYQYKNIKKYEGQAIKDIFLIKNLVLKLERNNNEWLNRINNLLDSSINNFRKLPEIVQNIHRYETVKNDFIYDYYYNELKKEEFEMALLTIENLKYPISKNNCLIIDDFINVKNNRQLIELLFDSMKTNSDNIKIKVGNTSYKVCINNSINKKIEESLYLLIKSKIKNRFNKFIYEN